MWNTFKTNRGPISLSNAAPTPSLPPMSSTTSASVTSGGVSSDLPTVLTVAPSTSTTTMPSSRFNGSESHDSPIVYSTADPADPLIIMETTLSPATQSGSGIDQHEASTYPCGPGLIGVLRTSFVLATTALSILTVTLAFGYLLRSIAKVLFAEFYSLVILKLLFDFSASSRGIHQTIRCPDSFPWILLEPTSLVRSQCEVPSSSGFDALRSLSICD